MYDMASNGLEIRMEAAKTQVYGENERVFLEFMVIENSRDERKILSEGMMGIFLDGRQGTLRQGENIFIQLATKKFYMDKRYAMGKNS